MIKLVQASWSRHVLAGDLAQIADAPIHGPSLARLVLAKSIPGNGQDKSLDRCRALETGCSLPEMKEYLLQQIFTIMVTYRAIETGDVVSDTRKQGSMEPLECPCVPPSGPEEQLGERI